MRSKMRMTPERLKVLSLFTKGKEEADREELMNTLYDHRQNFASILRGMQQMGFIVVYYAFQPRTKLTKARITEYGKKFCKQTNLTTRFKCETQENPCGMKMKICYHASKCHLSYKCNAAQHQ